MPVGMYWWRKLSRPSWSNPGRQNLAKGWIQKVDPQQAKNPISFFTPFYASQTVGGVTLTCGLVINWDQVPDKAFISWKEISHLYSWYKTRAEALFILDLVLMDTDVVQVTRWWWKWLETRWCRFLGSAGSEICEFYTVEQYTYSRLSAGVQMLAQSVLAYLTLQHWKGFFYGQIVIRLHSTTQAPVQIHLKRIRGAWGTQVSCAQAASDARGGGVSYGGTGMKNQPWTLTWLAHNNGHPAAGVTTLLKLWKLTAVALMLARCCVRSTVLQFHLNTQKEMKVLSGRLNQQTTGAWSTHPIRAMVNHNVKMQCCNFALVYERSQRNEGRMLTSKTQPAMI